MKNTELNNILNENRELLTLLRCNHKVEKNYIQNELGISFPTLTKKLDYLKHQGIIDNNMKINPDTHYSIGISVGGAQCKMIIVDASYHALEKDKFNSLCEQCGVFENKYLNSGNEDNMYGYKYFKTPDNILDLKEALDAILEDVIILHKKREDYQLPPIIGVGIALTGSIDAEKQIILKSHNVNYLENIKKEELITPEKLLTFKEECIAVNIDHNAKAVAVAEKFSLYWRKDIEQILHDKKNIACLYLGSGMCTGLVLNNVLIRGKSNLNGELGHIQVPRYPKTQKKLETKCSCGAEFCLEHLIINDVFSMSKEEFKEKTSGDLKQYLKSMEDKGKKEEVLKTLGYYVEWIIDMMIKLLNVDLVIFSGKTIAFIEEVWKYVRHSIGSINNAKLDCSTITSVYGALAPAIGAGILSTYQENAIVKWPCLIMK